ncbi:MAG: hypothetical protein II992_09620 [Lachnospiraceae bacterium]|nr:hypothetical protein [Lachnospiraceae bacterium]
MGLTIETVITIGGALVRMPDHFTNTKPSPSIFSIQKPPFMEALGIYILAKATVCRCGTAKVIEAERGQACNRFMLI